jgi:Dullard-like phosphatase family protein
MAAAPDGPRPVLVLDLDETLVCSVAIRPAMDHIAIRVGRRRVYVISRPGLPQFLTSISLLFDVCFFTASVKEYADQIIDAIAPQTPPERRFFRDSCTAYGGYPVKDLHTVKCSMDRVLLIDDVEGSALWQPENLIRISPWQGSDRTDSVLMAQLLPVLLAVAHEKNLPAMAIRRVRETGPQDLFPFRGNEWGKV